MSEKSPGMILNKAAEIRREASLLASQGVLPRPKVVREQLGRKGITVTSQQVSMALSKTEFAYRKNQPHQSPKSPKSACENLGGKSVCDAIMAIKKATVTQIRRDPARMPPRLKTPSSKKCGPAR